MSQKYEKRIVSSNKKKLTINLFDMSNIDLIFRLQKFQNYLYAHPNAYKLHMHTFIRCFFFNPDI